MKSHDLLSESCNLIPIHGYRTRMLSIDMICHIRKVLYGINPILLTFQTTSSEVVQIPMADKRRGQVIWQ